MESSNQKKQDIFDRIMSLGIFRPLNPLYCRYKEILLYLFFGGLTTIISIGSYTICILVMGMNVLVANVISWILAVLFAYITNRTWVFPNKAEKIRDILTEIISFFGGRLATLGMEELILFVCVTLLHGNSIVVKVAAQVVVLVSNYIISKLLVFRKR